MLTVQIDAPDQNLTGSVQITGQVNYQNVGDNNLVLSVTDDFGRSSSATLTVRVEDQTRLHSPLPQARKQLIGWWVHRFRFRQVL